VEFHGGAARRWRWELRRAIAPDREQGRGNGVGRGNSLPKGKTRDPLVGGNWRGGGLERRRLQYVAKATTGTQRQRRNELCDGSCIATCWMRITGRRSGNDKREH
jgi:hypothetical protein